MFDLTPAIPYTSPLVVMNIMICDPISPKGIALFQQCTKFNVTVLKQRLSEAELLPLVRDVEAMVVRSETKITRKVIEAAPKLRVVGRAGVGVDNVDVEAATQRGIVVMNTPSGNTISTAELTFAMLMALARKIPQAHASIKAGEWNRKAFQGVELYGKTLGILGMGRIGSEVARRAIAFGMQVLAYDPYLSLSRAKTLQVELVEQLEDLYARSDFITVHMPLSDETKGMLNAAAFAKMKKGVRVLNCARGGIVNEAAEAITDYLLHGAVRNAVNLPNLDAKTYAMVKPFLTLGEKLGRLLAQIAPKRNDQFIITYGGKATELPTDPITRSVLKGFLESAGGKDVNQVNVRALASSLGLVVEEIKSNEDTDYNEWLHGVVLSGGQRFSAGGTILGKRQQPRIVRLMGQPVEIVPSGILLLMNNKDRPGIVGHVGSLMARHSVNIASMSLNRDSAGGQALTVLNLDSVPPPSVLAEIQKDPDISNVKVVKL